MKYGKYRQTEITPRDLGFQDLIYHQYGKTYQSVQLLRITQMVHTDYLAASTGPERRRAREAPKARRSALAPTCRRCRTVAQGAVGGPSRAIRARGSRDWAAGGQRDGQACSVQSLRTP